jgi:hypothetical protein
MQAVAVAVRMLVAQRVLVAQAVVVLVETTHPLQQ